MRHAVPITLLVAVTALLALGAFAVNMQGGMQGESAVSCIAVAAKGVSCPENAGPIEFLSFHFNVLKDLAAAGAGAFAAAVLLTAMIATAFVISRGAAGPVIPSFAYERQLASRQPHAFTPPILQELRCWTALHVESPSVFLRHGA